MHTLPLSLDLLNRDPFAPESKEEDLHAGVLQLPQGTVLLVTEGGVSEGKLVERGQCAHILYPFQALVSAPKLYAIVDPQSRRYFERTGSAGSHVGADTRVRVPVFTVLIPDRY